jgi:hypothetical protein
MKQIILFVLLLSAGQLFAEECVFDPSSANASFLSKNQNVKHLVWDDTTKEARAILKDGSLLYIKRWACRHVAMDARLIEFYGKDDLQLQRAIWFGTQILDKSDFKILENSIKNKTYSREERPNGFILRIPHGTYSEFYVEFDNLNDMRVISIFYSFN